jgi:hypothetical protein
MNLSVGMAPLSNPNPDVRIPQRCPTSDFNRTLAASRSVKVYLNATNLSNA